MNNKPLKPYLRQTNVGSWASSELKDKVKYHLEMSVKAWHDWEIDLPLQVEVICNEVKRNRGQFLNVKRWLIIPPQSGLKECLVAEIDNDVHIHINHLVPSALFYCGGQLLITDIVYA